MNDNDSNVIKFPNPDEYVEGEKEREVVATVTIYDNGDHTVWISNEIDIDNDMMTDWLKIQAGQSLTSLYNFVDGVEDGNEYEGVFTEDDD